MDVALCLTDFPSEIVEKDNKPEIEMYGYNKKTKPLVLHPIKIAKSKKEKCLIEPSVNSCRVKYHLLIISYLYLNFNTRLVLLLKKMMIWII